MDMIIETSWDDGDVWDIRVASLLKKYNLPGTFYIPTWRDMSDYEVKGIADDGFDIGGHTVTHPRDMKMLPYPDLISEINNNKEYLEELTGKEVTSFCYPRGKYNEIVMGQVKEAGFKEARTTNVGHTSYPENKYRKHTSVHVFNGRNEYNGVDWFPYAIEKFNESKKGGYFHLWGHSWEVEKYNQWENLEAFFKILYDYQNK